MISENKIAEHHATLRICCDPDSPFYGMIDFRDGLLSLPVSDQRVIYDTMSPKLREMVDNYMSKGVYAGN